MLPPSPHSARSSRLHRITAVFSVPLTIAVKNKCAGSPCPRLFHLDLICDTVLSSRPACSLKVLSLSWNLDRKLPWHVHACVLETHMLQCSSQMCLRKTDIAFKKREHSASVTREKSLSLRLFLPLTCPQSFGQHWFHTSDTRWKASLPWHATSVRASHPKTSCVPQAQLQPHVIQKKTPCTSFPLFVRHLYCYVLCASFSVTPPCSQRVCGGGIALLQYLAQITLKSRAQQRTECEEKTFLKSSWSSRVRLHHQIFSINVVIRRAAFSGTCPYVFAPK